MCEHDNQNTLIEQSLVTQSCISACIGVSCVS